MEKMKKSGFKGIGVVLLLVIFVSVFSGKETPKTVNAATKYPYLIKVNKQQNCVTIYEKDKKGKYTVPVKAMVCSTGVTTPLGSFNTRANYRWKLLMDDVWGQYSTRIVGGILFHSVWYYKMDPSTLSAAQYNKLGITCSHGCIRLTVEDAKWIYDHCRVGTTVTIYNDKNPGPLGKPKAEKLPAGTGWDPTDPHKENPWRTSLEKPLEKPVQSKAPVITGAKSYSVSWGSKVDLRKNVKAMSGSGEDITSKIKIKGTVDPYTAGKYKITYVITDAKKKASKTITIRVKRRPRTIKLEGINDRVIDNKTIVDEEFCLQNVKAYYGGKELSKEKITVEIETYKDYYEVTYTAYANSKKKKSQTAYMYVDTTAPVLQGVKHQLIVTHKDITREVALEGVGVIDDHEEISLDDVQVEIEQIFKNGYLVTYTVSDSVGNTTKETIQITITDSVKILGVTNRVVPSDVVVDKAYAMQGIEGVNGPKDLTSSIQVSISEPEDDVYTVTYELSNEYDVYTKIVAFFKKSAK